MAYCTLAQIIADAVPEKIVAQCSNDADPTTVDTTIVNNLIAKADEFIDDYLRDRYTLPLANSHKTINTLSIIITAYLLQCRRGKVPELWQKRYDDAKATLLQLQQGKLTLDEGTTSADRPPKISVSAKTQVFTDTILGYY
jgi:phage gp36-like protein